MTHHFTARQSFMDACQIVPGFEQLWIDQVARAAWESVRDDSPLAAVAQAIATLLSSQWSPVAAWVDCPLMTAVQAGFTAELANPDTWVNVARRECKHAMKGGYQDDFGPFPYVRRPTPPTEARRRTVPIDDIDDFIDDEGNLDFGMF